MASDRVGRIAGLAVVAWISMLGVLAAMGAVKWNQPGFRDQDIQSPAEMAMTMVFVMAIPLALIAGAVLAPSALVADRIIRGRLTRGANTLIGACFSIPSILGFFGAGLLLFGNGSRLLANVRRAPDMLVGLFTIFAVGGIVISLGMRRRVT
jgi:hypothetical protein